MAVRSRERPLHGDQQYVALAVNLAHEDSGSLAGILIGSRWQLKEVQTCQEALYLLRNGPLPVVLCEPKMSDGTWNILLDGLRELAAPPPVIVVSRLADEHLWVEVLGLGGYDVLATPFDGTEVLQILSLAWMASGGRAECMPASVKKPPTVERTALSSKRRCASSDT
jgi:DNA-binding response OmpR family regulator